MLDTCGNKKIVLAAEIITNVIMKHYYQMFTSLKLIIYVNPKYF